MREIEAACGLHFTCIVNNTNLASETTPDTVLGALAYMDELSRISGLPLWLHTARADVAEVLAENVNNVFPLHLQEKYFDLPSQTGL